jgi:hypothetical protein
MCGCIEDMSLTVSRADCTQVDVTLTFTYNLGVNGRLVVEAGDDLNVEFNACKGVNFGTGNGKDNDLSAHVYKLVKDGKFSEEKQLKVYDVLVGYENPNSNDNEAACRSSFSSRSGGKNYPCTEIDDFVVGGCDYLSILDALQQKISRDKTCPHSAEHEVQIFTGASTVAEAREYIGSICSAAWDQITRSSFASIDDRFTNEFMAKYAVGGTFLNSTLRGRLYLVACPLGI